MIKLNNNKKINRRLAFRIYEQVNLFYHKIERSQFNEPIPNFDTILTGHSRVQAAAPNSQTSTNITVDQSLPDSQSQENDTLNVNLSASGIAFTCKDELKVGDYLLIRLFLISSMTVIMTCCKVVYCKTGNPYETEQYPYLVGANFVNLTAEDSALLRSIVSKRRKYQLIFYGLIFSLLMAVLTFPEEIFGLLLELADNLTDTVLDLILLVSDYFGLWLDYLIPYLFHTNPRVTDIVGFYIQHGIQFAVLVVFLRFILFVGKRLSQKLLTFLVRKKSSLLYYWGDKSWLDKIKLIGLGIAAISCYVLFAI